MIDAVCNEIKLQRNYVAQPLETIYFGGGTPSILDTDDIDKIFTAIHQNFSVAADPEITIETNPDDITVENLKAWKLNGINRLSMGIQSFFNDDLLWMNRAHNASQAVNAIKLAQDAGFCNITIDLIYGTPTLPDHKWIQNLTTAISLHIPHLSCYALTVEHKTALHKFIEKGKINNISAEQQARQFELLMKAARTAGYEHYEISNFAKPGFRSRHNSNYWSGKEYLGVGPSAHSFNGSERRWNIANNALYIQSLEKNIVPFEVEILSEENKMNEYIMTSLRTSEGFDLNYFSKRFGEQKAQTIKASAQRWMKQQWLVQREAHFILTDAGKLMADGIAADLFF